MARPAQITQAALEPTRRGMQGEQRRHALPPRPPAKPIPVNPTPAELKAELNRQNTYRTAIDLSNAALDTGNGKPFNAAGFGLYLSHHLTPPNTIVQIALDHNFERTMIMRPGYYYNPGPGVNPKRQRSYFARWWARIVDGGDTTGIAFMVVLGNPDAEYYEELGSTPYQLTQTTAVPSADTTVLAITDISTIDNPRIYVRNSGANDFTDLNVEISADGVNFAEILTGQLLAAAGQTLTQELPQGIVKIRVRANSAGATTAVIDIAGDR